ncbi:carbohydrate-binding module family 50 protein [Xylariaceae sp. FL1651]|nr:carbohydrate-binding module family 50 protein [Xylariaceae sp. FL1651]
MGRWSQYDTDEERLPEGMQRIGYDADDQTYTFRDAEGGIWESAPGNRYGQLHRVTATLPPYSENGEGMATQPLPSTVRAGSGRKASWRQEMMPLLNWFLLVSLFLLLVFWFISRGSTGGPESVKNCGDKGTPYEIKAGDTCWAIAEAKLVPLENLLRENEGLDCDKLIIGNTICVPIV